MNSGFYVVLASAFYGALATVNADTWATELGVLARGQPRLITSGHPVEVGTSGGVTVEGFAASLAGAMFIGVVGFVLIQAAARATTGAWLLSDWVVVLVAAISGFLGSAFDSLLGATAQAIYYCDKCGVETERTRHRCGEPTRLIRGRRWLNNDWVNFLASLAGALVAGILGTIWCVSMWARLSIVTQHVFRSLSESSHVRTTIGHHHHPRV